MAIGESTTSKRPFPLPRWLPWSHAAILAITTSFWGAFLLKGDPLGYVYKRDFLSVYIGARVVAEGQGPLLYDLDVQRKLTDTAISPYHRDIPLPYIYPAYVAVLLAPLGEVPLVRAFFLWAGINLLAAGWIAWRLMRYPSVFPAQRVTLLVAFLAWVPLQLTLSHGQMGLLCALALIEALVSLEARKPWQAGLWLALGLVKPQLIVFPLLSLLLWRCWPAIASFATALIALLGVSFAKLGFWIPDYLRFLGEFNRSGKELSLYPMAMPNWRGLVYALLGSDTIVAAHFLLVALTVGSIIVVIAVGNGREGDPVPSTSPTLAHWKARFAIATLLGILTSPYLYFHDWVIAFPVLTVLFLTATEWSRLSNRHWSTILLLWLIALSPFVCFAVQFGVWPSRSHIQLVPWYMGLLTTMAVIALKRAESARLNEKASC